MERPATNDLWHLTIDDLLASPAQTPRLAGPGPFAVNLSTSTAPISIPAEGFPEYEHLRLYQVKQTDEGRTRYRLRLGLVTTELEADAILSAVRERYPSAFATNASDDDLRLAKREPRTSPPPAQSSGPPPAAAAAPVSTPCLAGMLAEDPPAAAQAKVEAPVKAKPPAIPTPAPPAAESGVFTIDFDAFLPPMEPQFVASAAKPAAPVAAAATGAPKRSRSASKRKKGAAVSKTGAARQVLAPEVAPSRAPAAAPAVVAEAQPAVFVEPAHDPNAITDQVAVLTLPVDDSAGEVSVDDGVQSMILAFVPDLCPELEAELELAELHGTTQASAVAEPPAVERAIEHEVAFQPGLHQEPVAEPAAAPIAAINAPPAIEDELDLESVVARNNAMVDSLEARGSTAGASVPIPAFETTGDDAIPVLEMIVEAPGAAQAQLGASPDLEVELDSIDMFVDAPAVEPESLAPAVEPEAPVAETERAACPIEILADPLHDLDSTQTIRELTPLELADDQGSHWFAIQLLLSDDAVDAENVPHLDIFESYRLYSVAGLDQGKYMHALRLGFFSDKGAAQMVAGYLRSYFDEPSVKRVSVGERERFADRRVVPRRDIGATGKHTIIELSTAPRAPQRRLADLTVNNGQRAADSGSLWSRLVAPLKR